MKHFSAEVEAELKQLENIAWTMENLLPLPGTSVRLGLDSLLGIVPVAGDLLALGPAIYVIRRSSRFGVSRRVLIRMGLNVAIDLAIGIVPLVGDILDVTWNASTRNVALLRLWLETEGPAGQFVLTPAPTTLQA